MNAEIEGRLEYVEPAKCWVLKHDTGTTPHVKSFGRLDWDAPYRALKCWDRLKHGDLCVDVGAYIGDSCVPMVERGASVIAVECQEDAYECLKRNLPCVEAFLRACGASDELTGVHGGVGGNTGARPLVQGDSMRTVRLDDLVGDRAVKLLKIDVEGYERHVLDGAKAIMAQRPIVVVERNEEAMRLFGTTWQDIVDRLPGYRIEEWQHTEAWLWDYVAWPE
jgi:FkbM family methyltransferase